MRFFRRRKRKVLAVCDVYNEPERIAVLFKGERFYMYLPRDSALAREILTTKDKS